MTNWTVLEALASRTRWLKRQVIRRVSSTRPDKDQEAQRRHSSINSEKQSQFSMYRRRTWEFFDDTLSSRPAFIWYIFMMILVITSVVMMIVQSVESVVQAPGARDIFFWCETGVIAFFTFEFLIRFITCPNYFQYFTGFMNYVDALSIVPYYAMLPSELDKSTNESSAVTALKVLRILRLLRIIRILKVGRGNKMTSIFIKALQKARSGIGFLVFLVLMVMCISGTCIFYAETWDCKLVGTEWIYTTGPDSGIPTPFSDIPSSMWWCVVTLTTVGYGDMFPVTVQGRCVAIITMIISLIFLAYPITLLGSAFSETAAEFAEEATRQAQDNTVMSVRSSSHVVTGDQSVPNSDYPDEIIQARLQSLPTTISSERLRCDFNKIVDEMPGPDTLSVSNADMIRPNEEIYRVFYQQLKQKILVSERQLAALKEVEEAYKRLVDQGCDTQ